MTESPFHDIETSAKKLWETEHTYRANLKVGSKQKVFTIDTPPPTLSGAMHIGHAFSYAQQDFIARFRRMHDGAVFYPFGTDDNGLPTERLIEKTKGVKSKEMKRSDFIALCQKTLKELTPAFVQDWKDLGISCDYDMTYSTIDSNTQKISQKLFLDLVESDRAYKKSFPTLWCPECQTSIAQAELEDHESKTFFTTLKFLVGNDSLPIATTRPELLGACVAVFVNPSDTRYKKYVGKSATVPLFNFKVPVIADESAQLDKGTGVLMVCSYGDKFDVEAIQKHKLTPKIIIARDGTLTIPEYVGLKTRDARKKILQHLAEKNLIIEQKTIEHVVNVHDKCGTPIEFIPTEQWFIKILDLKQKLIEQGKKITWHPEHMFKRYENWVQGLEWDWNVSRDRHFGIPIPVWECPQCKELILPTEKELPVDPVKTSKTCKQCSVAAIPETKVLDTWATSSISPQICAHLSKDKVNLPFSLRPQAHDIIRTWAFYTITRAYLHEKKLPWSDIIISGNVSLGGEKMSKSKGNVISPKDVLQTYGADALRFWAAGSKLGEDLDYQEKDLVTGKKLLLKIQNATKFVFMNLEDYDFKKPKKILPLDALFLQKMNELITETTEAFESYEYSRAKLATEQFFWQIFCDNYLELVKKRVYSGTLEEKRSAQYVLYESLHVLLKLFAPIIPFMTEHLYQTYYASRLSEKSIHTTSWPELFTEKKLSGEIFSTLLSIVSKIRTEKSLAKKAMNSAITLTLEKEVYTILEPVIEDLKAVMNIQTIKTGTFAVEFI